MATQTSARSCALGTTTRSVSLQFRLKSEDGIPDDLLLFEKEALVLDKQRPVYGTLVIPPTERTNVSGLIASLEQSGYFLAHIEWRPRQSDSREYYVLSCRFDRLDQVEEYPLFSEEERQALVDMCETAMWRVRAWLNPRCIGGEVIPGENGVSIDLDSRKSFYDAEGKVVLERLSGKKAGKSLGEQPVPIKAKAALVVRDNVIDIWTI